MVAVPFERNGGQGLIRNCRVSVHVKLHDTYIIVIGGKESMRKRKRLKGI